MQRLLVFSIMLLSGCGPAPEPTRRPPQPPDPPPSRPVVAARTITDAEHKEIREAFAENPVAAKIKYEGVRWRFLVRVDDIASFGSLRTVIDSGGVGAADVHMRSKDESAKVKRGGEERFLIEAEIDDWQPNAYYGIEFKDGIVIKR